MAQNTSVALAAADVKQFVGSITPIYSKFDVTNLSAAITNADRIKICTLPANARIVGASWRVTGNNATTAIAHLQIVEPTGNAIFLTPTTGAPAAPSIALATILSIPHSPITSVTGTRDLEIVVATGSIANSTAGATMIVTCEYAAYP